jgi:predicted GNAT family acetyltransferase
MSTESAQVVVRDNSDALRYELLLDRRVVGELLYRLRPNGRISLVHTEVLPSYEGRGLAGRLVAGALDDARARGLQVVPICPYVQAYVRRHPEYEDILA